MEGELGKSCEARVRKQVTGMASVASARHFVLRGIFVMGVLTSFRIVSDHVLWLTTQTEPDTNRQACCKLHINAVVGFLFA